MNEDESIDALFADWKDAMARGDSEHLLTLIAEDAEFWTQGAAPVKGHQAVRTLFAAFFDTVSMQQEFQELERVVSGDIAFIRGVETNYLTPKAGGGPVEVHQRAFMLLRRIDGKWRFARGMTNREQ